MVTHFQYIPIDQLSYPHAEFFWVLEGKASKSRPYVHQIIPKGTCELIYLYKGSFKETISGKNFEKGELIIGAQKSVLSEYYLEEEFGMFGTCLKAYCLPVFLAVSGGELLNQDLISDDFKELSSLKEQLNQTNSNQARIPLMLQVLRQMGTTIGHYDPHFCEQINRMSLATPREIRNLALNTHVSLRQFQRKFKKLMGYTPSQILRITRLQPMLDQMTSDSLTQLALAFGFYDQSHFINDFKKITNGMTPGSYYAGKRELQWMQSGESVAFFQS